MFHRQFPMKFKKFIVAALVGLLAAHPLHARVLRGGFSFAPVGNAQIGLGGAELTAQSFTNLLNAWSYTAQSAPQSTLDGLGYPVANFTGLLVGGQIGPAAQPLSTLGPWTLQWDAGRSCFGLSFSGISTASSAVNATVTNNGGFNMKVTGNCSQAGSVTVNFASGNTNQTLNWDNTYTQYASNTGGQVSMCRSANLTPPADDCSQLALAIATNGASGSFWTPEMVAEIRGLHPEAIRPMGWNEPRGGRQSNEASWQTRATLGQLRWGQTIYPAANRSGGNSGLGTITNSLGALTAAPATNTPLSGWQNGETLYGNMTVGVGNMQVAGAVSNAGKVQLTVASASITGTTHGTTIVDSLSGTTGLYNGEPFYGPDIATGSYIASINSGCTAPCVVLSVAATGSNAGEALTAGGTTGLVSGNNILVWNVSGTTEANGLQLINSVDSNTQLTTNTTFVNAYSGVTTGNIGWQSLAITGKTGGSKLIVSDYGRPLSANATFSDQKQIQVGPATFIYNSAVDAVIYNANGTSGTVPLEAQIQLANLVNADYWENYSIYANDDFITQAANLAFTSLNSNLKYITELDNEVWNCGTFIHCGFAVDAGQWLGITPAAPGGGSFGPYQALRLRQINGNILPSTNWSGSMSRLVRTFMVQGGTSNTGTYPGIMAGTPLVGPGNAAYQAYAGGNSYNASPNRPIDFVDAIGYAPYTTGIPFNGPDVNYTPSSFDVAALEAIADNWINGNTATAIAAINASQLNGSNRVQSVTAAGTTFTTPSAHNLSVGNDVQFVVSGGTTYSGINPQILYQVISTPTSTTFTVGAMTNGSIGSAVNAGTAGTGTTTVGYTGTFNSGLFNTSNAVVPVWQNFATTAFTPAPAGGSPKVRMYEGGIEPSAPTISQLTNIGVVTPSTPAALTGTTHTTTVVDSLSTVSGLFVGMSGSATDITTAQTIASINSGCPTTCTGNYVVLSAAATGSNAGESITFSGTPALANSTLSAAISGWKFDNSASITFQTYFQMLMGQNSNYITFNAAGQTVAPSNLEILGQGVWSLNSNSSYTVPVNYKTYSGFCTFSGGTGC
jgi:hypothetical protein